MQLSALLLIEFQQEWLGSQGKLKQLFQDKAQYNESLENAGKVLAAARKTHLPIVHSGLSFSSNHRELGKAQNGLRAVIAARQTFVGDTYGSQFAAPFVPEENEFVVAGRIGSSAFAGSNLDNYLRNNRINNLYIMGYALHVCVESTLRAAHDLGYEVTVITDACAAFTAEQKKYVSEEIIHHFGVGINTKDFLTFLNQ